MENNNKKQTKEEQTFAIPQPTVQQLAGQKMSMAQQSTVQPSVLAPKISISQPVPAPQLQPLPTQSGLQPIQTKPAQPMIQPQSVQAQQRAPQPVVQMPSSLPTPGAAAVPAQQSVPTVQKAPTTANIVQGGANVANVPAAEPTKKASWAPSALFSSFRPKNQSAGDAANPFYQGNAPAKNRLVQELDQELEAAQVDDDAKWRMKEVQPQPAAQPTPQPTQKTTPSPEQPQPANGQIVSSRQDTGFTPAQIAAPRKVVKRTKIRTTQNSLQIAEVRDNMLIMKDGSFRAVIACKAINFDLMNSEEREAIEYSYQNFLNSLNFDVQVLVRSQKIDIAPYLDKLVNLRRNEENMLLGVLMDDYIAFIDALSREANIMSKSFFVCVNYYPIDASTNVKDQSKNFFKRLFSVKNQSTFKIDQRTYSDGMSKISDRCDAVLSGLYQTGIQCSRLRTKELAALFYDFYNPDTSVREPLGNFADTTTLYTGKGK